MVETEFNLGQLDHSFCALNYCAILTNTYIPISTRYT